MPYQRVRIDLAFKKPLSAEAQKALDNLKIVIKACDSFIENIIKGENIEENTTISKEHTCNHDISQPCLDEVDI